MNSKEIENIVRVGRNNEIQIPLGAWENIGVAPGDYVEFNNKTGANDEGPGEYEYIEIKKHPTSIIEIPTKEYIKLQELIDKKDTPFQTIDEAIIAACKKLLMKIEKN